MNQQFATIGLQEHCAVLSATIAELSMLDRRTFARDGVNLSFNTAADWLELASSVCNVEVLTKRFDDSVMFCSSARNWEDARSDLLSRLATELSVFQFAWGAFETVAKIIDPPSIPSADRPNGNNGMVIRTIYLLKQASPISEYIDTMRQMRQLLRAFPSYEPLLPHPPLPPHLSIQGMGLDFVRRVRNQFAHGSATLPYPDDRGHDWCGKASSEPHVIGLSTRIVLLSLQMLLAVFYRDQALEVSVLHDEDGCRQETDIQIALSKLHTDYRLPINDD